jgi:hypothetical protein
MADSRRAVNQNLLSHIVKEREKLRSERRAKRKRDKSNFNNFIDCHGPKDEIDPSFLNSISDDVFETHTSDEDNIDNPELCELRDPTLVEPIKTTNDKIRQTMDIEMVLKSINERQHVFNTTLHPNNSNTTSATTTSTTTSTTTTGSSKSSDTQMTIHPITKKRKLNSPLVSGSNGQEYGHNASTSKPISSAFEVKQIADELADYVNSSPSVLYNFGSTNTFECGRCYSKHKALIKLFVSYIHQHFLDLLPEDIHRYDNISSKNQTDTQSFEFPDDPVMFGSTNTNHNVQSSIPTNDLDDYSGCILSRTNNNLSVAQTTSTTNKDPTLLVNFKIESKVDDFGVINDHPYTSLNQFNLLQHILKPLVNKTNHPDVNSFEMSIQSNRVIRIDTFYFVETKGESGNINNEQQKHQIKKHSSKTIWEVSVFWLSKEDSLTSFDYDMFLITVVKHTISYNTTNNSVKGVTSSDTEKTLKTYIFLHCQ